MQTKKSGLKRVNSVNEKISIFSFMKSELKLLPPQLLKNVANKCLKKPPILDITQFEIIKGDIFLIVSLIINILVLISSIWNQTEQNICNVRIIKVQKNRLLQLSIIIHAFNAKMFRVKHQSSMPMILLCFFECLSLQYPGI